MTADMGLKVPSNVVQAGGNNIVLTAVADEAITPTNLVKFDTSQALLIKQTASGKNTLGVADRNEDAIADDQDPMTHAYADGEVVNVVIDGMVVVVADTTGFTRGGLVAAGDSDGAEVEDYTDTAANAGDTYLTANLEAIKDELGAIIGRALTSAATTVKGVIKLF